MIKRTLGISEDTKIPERIGRTLQTLSTDLAKQLENNGSDLTAEIYWFFDKCGWLLQENGNDLRTLTEKLAQKNVPEILRQLYKNFEAIYGNLQIGPDSFLTTFSDNLGKYEEYQKQFGEHADLFAKFLSAELGQSLIESLRQLIASLNNKMLEIREKEPENEREKAKVKYTNEEILKSSRKILDLTEGMLGEAKNYPGNYTEEDKLADRLYEAELEKKEFLAVIEEGLSTIETDKGTFLDLLKLLLKVKFDLLQTGELRKRFTAEELEQARLVYYRLIVNLTFTTVDFIPPAEPLPGLHDLFKSIKVFIMRFRMKFIMATKTYKFLNKLDPTPNVSLAGALLSELPELVSLGVWPSHVYETFAQMKADLKILIPHLRKVIIERAALNYDKNVLAQYGVQYNEGLVDEENLREVLSDLETLNDKLGPAD